MKDTDDAPGRKIRTNASTTDARSDWVRSKGVDQTQLKEDEGLVFVVRKIDADYFKPAKFDEELTVETRAVQVTGARLVMEQIVKRDNELLFQAMVTVVCANEAGQAARLPQNLRLMLH